MPEKGNRKGKVKGLRFDIGDQVVCNTSEGWEPGTIVDLWYRQQGFPPGFYAPYQVELDSGSLIFVPDDLEQLCRKRELTWWEKALGDKGGGPPEARIKKGATAPGVNVDQRDFKERTALSECARLGGDACTRVLLKLGANPNTVDKEKRTPLIHAVAVRRVDPEQVGELVKVLLEGKADPNVQDRDPDKDPDFSSTSFEEREQHRTPLHYCAAWNYLSAAKALLKASASLDIIDAQYKTPLHLAIDEQASHEMVTLLLSSKADPDKGNIEIGMTSSYLMVAARNGDAQLASALINAKADINLAGKQGMTPLHMAVRSRKDAVAKLLVDAGCDTGIKALGKSAGEIALTNGQTALAALLGVQGSSGGQGCQMEVLDEKVKKDLFLE